MASEHQPGRGRIYNSITETIGDTPLVRLNRMAKDAGVKADILLKLEFFNPIASVKDRIGVAMIEAMEAKGIISPGQAMLVEPTSGNTGIALAFVAAAKGYRLILVMPESDVHRAAQDAARCMGAELVLTRSRERHEGRHRAGARNSGGDARRGHAAAIRKSRQSRHPPPHHRRGNLERHATARWTWSCRASAPAAPSPASARC